MLVIKEADNGWILECHEDNNVETSVFMHEVDTMEEPESMKTALKQLLSTIEAYYT